MKIVDISNRTNDTFDLIVLSSKNKIPIIVEDGKTKSFIKIEAMHLGLDIPDPIIYSDLIGYKAKAAKPPEKIYVYNLDSIIKNILGANVVVATINDNPKANQIFDYFNCFM